MTTPNQIVAQTKTLSQGERLVLALSFALANQVRTTDEVKQAREHLLLAEKAAQAAREAAKKLGDDILAYAEQLDNGDVASLDSPRDGGDCHAI
ncbi:hypothetical protein V2J83_11730 [Pseudomonas alliivorans]|nr:hypothetical protein [Pseudomonas alliivorans]